MRHFSKKQASRNSLKCTWKCCLIKGITIWFQCISAQLLLLVLCKLCTNKTKSAWRKWICSCCLECTFTSSHKACVDGTQTVKCRSRQTLRSQVWAFLFAWSFSCKRKLWAVDDCLNLKNLCVSVLFSDGVLCLETVDVTNKYVDVRLFKNEEKSDSL